MTGNDTRLGGARRRLYLSFDRRDAVELAERLAGDLEADQFETVSASEHGRSESEAQIRQADALVAILTPSATRADIDSASGRGSRCLDEIASARFGDPRRPIVPVLAIACEVPLMIFRLQYIDMRDWREPRGRYQESLAELIKGIDSVLGVRAAERPSPRLTPGSD